VLAVLAGAFFLWLLVRHPGVLVALLLSRGGGSRSSWGGGGGGFGGGGGGASAAAAPPALGDASGPKKLYNPARKQLAD